jgi:outer membrane protein assembly factor BamE (lipoprotein component of BamABCDE complex)
MPVGGMRARHIKTGFQMLGATLAVTVTLLVGGCSGNRSSNAGAGLMNVEIGMTESQVLAIMGQPQRRESHGGTEFLIYAIENDNKAALLNFIPIAIVDRRVTGIDLHVYDQVVRSMTQSDLNPQQESSKPRR